AGNASASTLARPDHNTTREGVRIMAECNSSLTQGAVPSLGARISPDVIRFAIMAGMDSEEFLTGWIFTDGKEAERALRNFPLGACMAVLPDAAMAARIAAQEKDARARMVCRADGTFDRMLDD